MQSGAGRNLSSLALVLSAAAALAACGGGGGSTPGTPTPAPAPAPAPPPAPTYGLSGTVSGMNGGTLVLQVNTRPDTHVSANGDITLASGLATGTAYTVIVKTSPANYTCTVANGTGTIASANVSNVQVTCAPTVVVGIGAPADNTLVPVDYTQYISVSFAGTTADRLTWTVLPSGIAADATVTLYSSGANNAILAFTAQVPADYTVRVSTQDDTSKTDEIDFRVHQEYNAIAGKSQQGGFVQINGRIRSQMPGAPADSALDIASGYRFSVALKTDGTVTQWGPSISSPVPSGLTEVTAVAAGAYFAMAQKQDDTLVVWGKFNQEPVLPAELVGTKVIAFDASLGTMQAIKEDGTLVVWRETGTVVPENPDWQNKKFKKVCGTNWHVVAVDVDGGVFAWNPTNNGDPAMNTVPATSGKVAAVFCGSAYATLVQEDGRVMTWGEELGAAGPFDSNTVPGFPRIKDVASYAFFDPVFLTETGAVIEVTGELYRAIDDL